MESLDLRDLVADEVEYRGLDKSVIGKAIEDIKRSDRLMQLLDMVVDEALSVYECKGLCGNCAYFVPNGGVTSDGAIYQRPWLSRKLGECKCPIEPPCGRLKNESNGCDYWACSVDTIF